MPESPSVWGISFGFYILEQTLCLTVIYLSNLVQKYNIKIKFNVFIAQFLEYSENYFITMNILIWVENFV